MKYLCKFFQNLCLICLFLIIANLSVIASDCGCKEAKIDDIPKTGTIFLWENVGIVKNLKGVVLFPDATTELENAVVEIYKISKNTKTLSEVEHSYEEIKEITKKKRKAACLTAENGKFCFPKLSKGKYLLKIGHKNDSQFSAKYIFVTIDKKNPQSIDSELKVSLVLSI